MTTSSDPWWLDPPDLIELVRLGPLVSIDLVVTDAQGRILIGLRNNEPAKSVWFVPGGRVGKDESLDSAFLRIVKQELGIEIQRNEARFLGVYEHFYDANFLERPGLTTHYVVLAHALSVPDPAVLRLDGQHREIRWLALSEILADPDVHPNTKVYADLPSM